MSHKILYFDTETTGLNPITCGLIQFSCIIEVDGKPLSKGNMHIAPFHTDLVEPSALAINGHSVETIKSFEPPLAAHRRLVKSLSTYVDQFDPTDKFFIAAPELKKKYGERFKEIPWESVAVYTYLTDRVGVGLKQLLAGNRKWKLELVSRNDLMSLSERATKVTGIPMPDEFEKDAIEKILG